MRMRRASYKLSKEKHKKLMERLIDEGKNFNQFVDRAIDLYLADEFSPFTGDKEE